METIDPNDLLTVTEQRHPVSRPRPSLVGTRDTELNTLISYRSRSPVDTVLYCTLSEAKAWLQCSVTAPAITCRNSGHWAKHIDFVPEPEPCGHCTILYSERGQQPYWLLHSAPGKMSHLWQLLHSLEAQWPGYTWGYEPPSRSKSTAHMSQPRPTLAGTPDMFQAPVPRPNILKI